MSHLFTQGHELGQERLVEQVYNHVYTLAIRGISADELEDFIHLFGRIAQNFAPGPEMKK